MIRPVIVLLLAQLAHCIDISDSRLKQYSFEQIIGVHDVSLVKDTPPSVNNLTFYISIHDGPKKQQPIEVDGCPANSQICGINTVALPGQDKLITEIISFPHNMVSNVESKKDTLDITLEGANWGKNSINAAIQFKCASADSSLQLDSWDGQTVSLSWSTPAACLKGEKTPPPPKKGDDKKKQKPDYDADSSSWGWFTWLFIFMVIIFAAYVIGNAWINSTGSNEFANELVDSLVDVLHRLPSFLKEIWNKIFGNNERGGYSAV